MEELLNIEYKGRRYTLKELIEADNQFSKALPVTEAFHVSISKMQWAFTMDYGYMIAADKFNQLYHLLTTSKFALTQAFQKIHKSPILWTSGYLGQLWLRSQYLKNAFLWYNSTDDYLLQIIWFAFDFFKHQDMTDKERYKKELKNCRWDKLFKVLKNRDTEPEIARLLSAIEAFHNHPKIVEIREIANSLKHHANLEIKHLEGPESISISSHLGFNSEAVENKQLDIDDACELLREGHQVIIGFTQFLLDFIDFRGAFPPEIDGVINMDQSQPKTAYKKFFINP